MRNSCPLECIEPKCTELTRIRDLLIDKLSKRTEKLLKAKELFERIQRVSLFEKGIANTKKIINTEQLD